MLRPMRVQAQVGLGLAMAMPATARFRTTHAELQTARATNASRQSCDQDQQESYQRNDPTVAVRAH